MEDSLILYVLSLFLHLLFVIVFLFIYFSFINETRPLNDKQLTRPKKPPTITGTRRCPQVPWFDPSWPETDVVCVRSEGVFTPGTSGFTSLFGSYIYRVIGPGPDQRVVTNPRVTEENPNPGPE